MYIQVGVRDTIDVIDDFDQITMSVTHYFFKKTYLLDTVILISEIYFG